MTRYWLFDNKAIGISYIIYESLSYEKYKKNFQERDMLICVNR